MRRTEPDERRDEVDALVARLDLGRERLGLLGAVDDPQPVAQPLDRGTGHEDRALEHVGGLAVDAPADARQQAVLGVGGVVAGVQQQERPGAVGVLRRAGRPAALPEQRGLLVAADPGDRCVDPEECVGVGVGDVARGVPSLWQHRPRHVQQRLHLVGPAVVAHVPEHRAAGVGRLRDVRASAGELPAQPGVHGSEGEVPGRRTVAGTVDVVQQPRELRAGEVRVDDQAGRPADPVDVAGVAQLVAVPRGAAVLPHDRVVDRLARAAVPDHDRLALVGDPDARDVARRGVRRVERLTARGQCRVPDLGRVVLDPAGTGEVLRELAVARSEQRPLLVHDHAADTGGALVDAQDPGHVASSRVGHRR